ncbi:uncharacterized protein Sptz [Anabrus simplex]|uniref:uncharacterized protein Sptz n=1 Tax=Anabrus simplex TaxID=316456 RepID=UPI0035A2B66A
MDRLCHYLRLGLWDLAAGLFRSEDSDIVMSKKTNLHNFLKQAILNSEQLCLCSPLVRSPWQQIYLASSVIHHDAAAKGGELVPTVVVDSQRKMAEFQCILSSFSPPVPAAIVENLCHLYDLVIHADQIKESVDGLSVEAHSFLCRRLMKDAVSANTIIQHLLCLWCPFFARTDNELQELYAECLKSGFQYLELKGMPSVGSGSSCVIEGHDDVTEINFAELLLVLSLFEVSEEKEHNLLSWISTYLSKLLRNGVLSQEMIYLTLLSRFNLKLLRSVSTFENKYYFEISSREDPTELQDVFNRLINFDGKFNVEDLFQMMMATRIHWMGYIIDTCSKLIMTGGSSIRHLFLCHPTVRKILPLLSVNSWCNFIDNSDMFEVLSFLIEECKKFKTDPVFSHLHAVLEHQMLLVKWCKMYGRNAALQSNEILHLVKENSTLETIRRTTNLAEVDWMKISEILVQSHSQEVDSSVMVTSTPHHFHWDVITFEGFCVLMMAFQIIQKAIEIEKLVNLKQPSTKTDSNDEDKLSFQKLYSEGVSERIQEMKHKICHIFPLNFRIELLENIFSLLFLRHENFQEEYSSDSGAEDDDDDRILESWVCSLSSDSSGRTASQHTSVLSAYSLIEDQSSTSVSGEFSRNPADMGRVILSSKPSVLSRTVGDTVPEHLVTNELLGSVSETNVPKGNSKVSPDFKQLHGPGGPIAVSDSSSPNKAESKLPSFSLKTEDENPYQSLDLEDMKVGHEKIVKSGNFHGFLCGVNVVRDLLHCLKECVINTSGTFYSVHASSETHHLHSDEIPSSISVDSLQLRLNRLSQCVNESSWRLQLLADVDFVKHIGQLHHLQTSECDYFSLTWQYSAEECESESEDESEVKEAGETPARTMSLRRSKSETEKSIESGSESTPTENDCDDLSPQKSKDEWFDTGEGESDSESGSKNENEEQDEQHDELDEDNVLDMFQPFPPSGDSRQKFVFSGASGANVDFDDESNVLEYFEQFIGNNSVGHGHQKMRQHKRSAIPPVSECIITQMMSSKSSLVIQCLTKGDFAKAKQVIQMCDMEDSALAIDVYFTEAYQILRQKLKICAEGSSGEMQTLRPTREGLGTYIFQQRKLISNVPSLQSIKQVATAGVHSTSLTSEVERFLSVNSLPEVQGIKEIIRDFPQTANMMKIADSGISLATMDLALTVGITYEHSVSLLDLLRKHCPDLQATGFQGSPSTDIPGSMQFMQNMIQSLKLTSTEHCEDKSDTLLSYKISLRDLLSSVHSFLSPKSLKEHVLFWNTIFSLVRDFQKNMGDCTTVISSSIQESPESKETSERKDHSAFRKLMTVIGTSVVAKESQKSPTSAAQGDKICISYLEWLYTYLKLLSVSLMQNVPSSIFTPSYFSILQESVVALFGRLVFEHNVPPIQLEPVARKIHHNLVYSVVHNCCPIIPDRALERQTPSHECCKTNVGVTWGKVILNDCNEPYDGTSLHPVGVVQKLLSELLEELANHGSGDVLNQEAATEMASHHKVQEVLFATRALSAVDLSLLVSGDEMLAFFINITNLLWIHSLLVLECDGIKSQDNEEEEEKDKKEKERALFGLLSKCPVKRFVSLKCVGYKVGQLGFLSLFTLQQLLYGKESAFPFDSSLKSFIRSEEDKECGKGVFGDFNFSSDPRSLFVLMNGQQHSPKVQVMNVEDIDKQLDSAMVEFLNHNVTFNEGGQLVIPYLLHCYQEMVCLNQEPESSATLPALARPGSPNHFSSDTDSVEKKSFSSKENLLHLMDFVRDHTSGSLQNQLADFSKMINSADIESARERAVVEEPSYEFNIVLDYSTSENQIAPSSSSQHSSDLETSWKKIDIPDIVLKFFESHCWLLSVLVHKIHWDKEFSSSVSEVKSQELDDRTRYLSQLFSAEWVAILKPMYQDNSVITALHPEPHDEILWKCLNKILQDRQWKLCQELLWALPETMLHSDSKLQAVNDDVLCELASKLPDKDCPNPWWFFHHIGDISRQAECALNNLPLWPGSACTEALRAMLEDNCRNLSKITRLQLELNLHKIQIYNQILLCCSSPDMKSWYDVRCLSESDPGLILQQLINAKQFQLCLRWADLHGIHNRSQELIDHKFLLLLLDQEPLDFTAARKLLLSLSPKQAIQICDDVLQQLRNLSCVKFIINLLLDTFSSSLQPTELIHYRLMSVGVQMLTLVSPTEQFLFWDLISEPQLIIEQLIMNTRLKMLEKILEVLHPALSQFPVDSPLSVNRIDSMLREYATKALDFRVRQTQVSSLVHPSEEKLLVSLSVASSHSEEFLMPAEVPAKSDWVPNDEVSQCMCCKSVNFSMFNRRHHCRRCGRVICAMCSSKRMKVAGYRDVNVRVCDCCYEQSHALPDVSAGVNQVESFLESSSSVTQNFWKLTLDESHNSTVREEFGFEHAPSVSLCLSILQLHSEQTAYPRFLVDSCDRILRLLQPVGPGAVNPEVDHSLVIRMVRSLVVAAKVKYARYGLNTGVVDCDQLLSQVDLLSMLVNSGCSALIPAKPLNGHALRRLRDRLVEEEMWTVAMEVSTKSGLDRAGVWAAWGKACLQAGCWEEAREKFSHCLVSCVTPGSDSARPLRNPPLLNEIIQILESGAYTIKASKDTAALFGFSSSALSVLHTLSSLREITQGKYNEATPPSNTIIIGPKLDPLFYSECCSYLTTYGSHAGIVAFYLSHDDLPAALQHIQQQKVDVDTFLETVYLPCLVQGNTSTLQQEMSQMDSSLDIWKSYLCHVCHHFERKGHLNVLYQLQLFMQDYVRAAMTCIRFYQYEARTYSDLAAKINFLNLAQSHLEKELGASLWGVKGGQDFEASTLKMKLDPREVDRHINTILRQIEVTKFLSTCEQQQRPVLEILRDLFPDSADAQHIPTLFGKSMERGQLAVLAILCGKNVEEGFGIAVRIIQDYHLKALRVFSHAGRKFANDSRLCDIEQLIGCIRNSGMSDVNTICDEVLAGCVEVLAAKPDPVDIESLVKLMVDVGTKVTAYIECKQLKSAYLLAVKHDRLGDVRRILREAEHLGQTAIRKICQKRLDHSSAS